MARKKGKFTDDSTVSPGHPVLSSLDKESLIQLLEKIITVTQGRIEEKYIKEKVPEDTIPVEIFSGNLSPAEAAVKYLKENAGMRLRQIALSLGRDERGIWGSYARAKKICENS